MRTTSTLTTMIHNERQHDEQRRQGLAEQRRLAMYGPVVQPVTMLGTTVSRSPRS